MKSFRTTVLLGLLASACLIAGSPTLGASEDGARSSITADAPTARFSFSPFEPEPGQLITFDASASEGEGGIISYQWDTTGDGSHDRAGKVIRRSYEEAGEYPVTLIVHDATGRVSKVTRVVRVGIQGAWLSITTDPPGLTVYLDGERMGVTPIELVVEPGERHLRLRHYWRGEWETAVDMSEVRSLALELVLWNETD